MFGMEIALEAGVREGRFLSKQAVRASGNGARSCTPLRCATHRTGSASRDHLEASDWPLSEARVIFRGGEMALRPFYIQLSIQPCYPLSIQKVVYTSAWDSVVSTLLG